MREAYARRRGPAYRNVAGWPMGWRFRKSFKVMPGVRLNVSRRSVSATLGGGPFSVNVSSRGTYANASIPGTGMSYRQRLSGPPPRDAAPSPPPPPDPAYLLAGPGAGSPGTGEGLSPEFRDALERLRRAREAEAASYEAVRAAGEIRSASTAVLTSPSLTVFRDALQVAQQERDDLAAALATALPAAAEAEVRHRAWADGFFWRRVRPARFAAFAAEAEEMRARADELEEQLRLTTLATEITLPPEDADVYGALTDAFDALSRCASIWDTTHRVATDRVRQRTIAEDSIERTPVRFGVGAADVITSAWRVPHLGNANGGDLYLYPGFVLYRVSRGAFAVLEARDVAVEHAPTRFVETDRVPPDSEIVGQTWRYANKNGTPDRRYADNPAIPLARYGAVRFRSASGLREDYLVSDDTAAERFAAAWHRYTSR